MRRVLVMLVLVILVLMLSPVSAESAERPCVKVQIAHVWARQCSPFVFTEIECLTDENTIGVYAYAQVCVPTDP